MTDFTFTASAECGRCGKYLSSSDASCDNCTSYDERRYHFVRMGDRDDVELVWAITPVRAWAALRDVVDDEEEVLKYKLYESGAMALHMKQMGHNPLDEDELRQSKLP